MTDPLAVTGAVVTTLQRALQATNEATEGHRSSRQQRKAAYERFEVAASRLIHQAQYLKAVTSASDRNTAQLIAVWGAAMGHDLIRDEWSFRSAARPALDGLIAHGLAIDLATLNENRLDVRQLFEQLQELTSSLRQVQRLGRAQARDRAEALVEPIAELFASLPGNRPLRSRVGRGRRRWDAQSGSFSTTMQRAWEAHRRFVAVASRDLRPWWKLGRRPALSP
jgi:hypothetical protein